jgi:2-polyprenyl-6-methoxyphenol hydroxylase-like FAD-dependent oxidoreductase
MDLFTRDQEGATSEATTAGARAARTVDVCIVGCGPAGAMLGLLCARAGLTVLVAEKNKQFEREFRGEGITPGGVKCLSDHGILDKLGRDGYVVTQGMRVIENGTKIFEADFSELRTEIKFAIDLPQPALIKAIVDESLRMPGYELAMGCQPRGFVKNERGQITGVTLERHGETVEVAAKLVVGCDGRYSAVRKLGGFAFKKYPMDRDVVWFKMERPPAWRENYTTVRIVRGEHLIILPCYPNLLRVGMYMPKGGFSAFKKQGLDEFHRKVSTLEPCFAGHVEQAVQSWSDVVPLDIFALVVKEWSQDGLMLLGDAAHTCSPILGQGVNLALRDSVDLAPVLVRCIKDKGQAVVTRADLLGFERKRRRDIRYIRGFQNRNERLLSFSSALSTLLRRLLYRLLDVSPFKPRLMAKVAMGARSAE